MLLGRDPSNDLVLTDAGVSWHHARVEDRGDSWAVVDLGSTNGTFVNRSRVSERVLRPSDKLRLGRTVLRFEVQDVLEQAYGELMERMLTIDDLSGLYLRRKFDAELELLLLAAREQKRPVGLLVMDLDGIKPINDTHGHLFGAYVIGEAGRVIGQVIRERGVGSRFGGDEFLAALREADVGAAAVVGREILQAIGAHHFEREGIVLRPGISIGVASFPESAPDAATLFQKADEALYRAKRGGKNRVCT
jgi:two-component system cell cycle response regulator